MDTLAENSTALKNNQAIMSDVPAITITQTFNVSVEEVFDAWKTESQMKEWCSPEGMTVPTMKIDFRVGGKFLLEMKNEEMDIFGTGTYMTISPYRLIKYLDQFSDKEGNTISPVEAGMGPAWEGADACIVTVRFRPIGKTKTELQLTHEGIPLSEQEDCRAGWTSCFVKLKTLLEKH